MEEITNMTAERSLEIIRESIERSQRTINKNSALPLIWWGACVVAFSLLIAYLWNNYGGPVWNFLWAAMSLVGYAGNRLIDKSGKPSQQHSWAKPSDIYGLHLVYSAVAWA